MALSSCCTVCNCFCRSSMSGRRSATPTCSFSLKTPRRSVRAAMRRAGPSCNWRSRSRRRLQCSPSCRRRPTSVDRTGSPRTVGGNGVPTSRGGLITMPSIVGKRTSEVRGVNPTSARAAPPGPGGDTMERIGGPEAEREGARHRSRPGSVAGTASRPRGGGMGYDLGVDLGTTFVAAAISRDGRAEMCTLGSQTVVEPAVVYLGETSRLVFGEAAERRALTQPDRVEREFKRRLGDPTPIVLGGVPYHVTALMGALLKDVLAKVTAVEGVPPLRVALTYPANWGPYRRELFEEVPQRAGLTGHLAPTQPEAAAAYYATSRDLEDGATIAVYDLGGGTFDAAVLRKHDGTVDLVGEPEGIERLGGVDFDEGIIQWINYSHGGVLAELDMAAPQVPAAMAKLRQECVQAKEALSSDTETTIPVLLPNRHFSVRLTRRDFEGMIRAEIEATIGALVRAVRTAHLDVDQLSSVLLVGGSSRIPLVERMISEELARPTVVDAHPKYSVALGAAMVAAGRPSSPAAEGHRRPPPAPVIADVDPRTSQTVGPGGEPPAGTSLGT